MNQGLQMMDRSTNWQRYRVIIAALILVAFPFILNLQVTGFDFIAYDDPLLVTDNSEIDRPSLNSAIDLFRHPVKGTYTPIRYLSHMMDHAFFGKSPAGHHFTNLVLHCLNSLLAFVLIISLSGSFSLSLFSAFLFSVHPVTSEVVAWVSARKELLLVLFTLSSSIAYLRFLRPAHWIWGVVSLILYGLACLSKVTASFIFPVFLFFSLSRKGWRRYSAIFHITLAIPIALLSLTLHKSVTAMISFRQPDLFEKILIAQNALCHHLMNFLVPIHLSPTAALDPLNLFTLSLLSLILMIILFCLLALKNRRVFFILISALLPLLPVVLYSASVENIAPHYLYLSLIPLCWFAVVVIVKLPKNVGKWVLLVLIFSSSVVTFNETRKWKDSPSLFTTILVNDHRDFRAAISLANYYFLRGEIEKTFQLMISYLSIKPYHAPWLSLSSFLLKRLGLEEEARIQFLQFLTLKEKSAHQALLNSFAAIEKPRLPESRHEPSTIEGYLEALKKEDYLKAFVTLSLLRRAQPSNHSILAERILLSVAIGLLPLAESEIKSAAGRLSEGDLLKLNSLLKAKKGFVSSSPPAPSNTNPSSLDVAVDRFGDRDSNLFLLAPFVLQ